MTSATDTSEHRVRLPSGAAQEGEEVWAIQVAGSVSLRVTTNNRFGQAVEGMTRVGPNRKGHSFRIKTVDREENQARCYDPQFDPFLNGMLVRVDADQQQDPATASSDALTTEQLLDIYEITGVKFERKVKGLGEIPLRRLVEVGESMDASHKQITFVRDLIAERYTVGGPQTTLEAGEHLS